MRLIHTADWHLGRLFHGLHMTEDQSHVLEEFLALVKDSRPDAVIIAGDLYDRAVPPPDAVRLLDEVFSRLVDMNVAVGVIAGNHDSPDRLGFGSRLFSHKNLHVSSVLEKSQRPMVIHDKHGPVHIHLLPFAEPPVARAHTGDQAVRTHATAMEALVQQAWQRQPKGDRSVLVAHATVVGGKQGESERNLGALAGGDAIAAEKLGLFDYVALGHLHPRQTLGDGRIHYPGSLLPYTFGEIEDERGISLVEMDERGQVRIDSIELTPRRQIRKIRGYLQDLLKDDQGRSRDDYICAVLYDEGALLDPIGRLREVYPNVLQIERTFLDVPDPLQERVDHRKRTPLQLFEDFFHEVTGVDLTEDEHTALTEMLESMAQQEREATV